MCLDGMLLALGEFAGRMALFDLRTGRRLWREESFGPVADLHVCALSGRVACVSRETGVVVVRAGAGGQAGCHLRQNRVPDPRPG